MPHLDFHQMDITELDAAEEDEELDSNEDPQDFADFVDAIEQLVA